MTKPAAKPFVSRASNTSDGMAALTRLPGVIITAFQQWKVIEIIVRGAWVSQSLIKPH